MHCSTVTNNKFSGDFARHLAGRNDSLEQEERRRVARPGVRRRQPAAVGEPGPGRHRQPCQQGRGLDHPEADQVSMT
jgi:hypothetical protein